MEYVTRYIAKGMQILSLPEGKDNQAPCSLFREPRVDRLPLLLPLERGSASADSADFSTPYGEAKRAAVTAFEAKYFGDLFRATSGNVSEMARRSGMERHHIRPFLRKLGLSKS